MTQEWAATSSSIDLRKDFDESAIRPLASLYSLNFGLIRRELGQLLACVSIKNLAGLYREIEYYAFPTAEVPRRMGQLDRGGKSAKKARRAASMSLRIRMWYRLGIVDKAGNVIEEGEVRFYNPVTKQVQKQTMAEAVRWTRDFLRPLRSDWRAKMEASNQELDDIYNSITHTTKAEVAFIEHMRKVWYLLHVTEAPVEMIHEVVWREPSMATCKAMLDELKGENLADFNFRHLQVLYS